MTSSQRSVLHIGNFLSARGFNRQFIEDLADRQEASGWVVFRTSDAVWRPRRVSEMVATIWRRRRDFSVAHVTLYSGAAFLWAEAAALALGAAERPFILSLHGGNLPRFAERWPRRVERLLRAASAVIAPSGFLAEQLRRGRADIVLIPNPIDVGAFPFRRRAHPEPRLVWLRAFHEIYNPTLAPRILALLAADHPDLRLTMVGPDMGDGSLQRTMRVARELDVAERITHTGPVPKTEVGRYLDGADVFLNTSSVDNTPISVLEALACGLCVVSTDVGGIPWLLDDRVDALLYRTDDAEAAAAAISCVLKNQGLARQLSQQGRAKAESRDWSAVLPQWDEILTSAAAGAS